MPAAARPSASASILARDGWDAAPPGFGMRPHTIERITIHHTGPPAWYGSPATPAYLRTIQAFHQGPERRWPDIAYHLLVDLDGAVWEGRSLAFAGDTATGYDPAGHALIAALGDYDVQAPNDAQVESLRSLIIWFAEAYSVGTATLAGHGDYAATACPGANLYALMDELRRSA